MSISPISRTIFPNSAPEIDKSIVSFSNNRSLYNLSLVSWCAHETLSNGFFKNIFYCQHPDLAKRTFKFEYSRHYFPFSYWKIACCTFQDGEFRLSRAFILENSPNIYNCMQSQKIQTDTELNKISGKGFRDPNSQTNQAEKAYENLMQSAREHGKLLKSSQGKVDHLLGRLTENCPEIHRIIILETAGNFAPVLKHYTDEQILNPNDQETIDIHEELFTYYRKRHPSDKSDESVRTIVDDQISTTLPNLNAILTSNPESDNSNLIRSLAEALVEQQSLIDRRFNYEAGSALKKKCDRLHEKSVRYAERFETIEQKLSGFSTPLKVSGEVHCCIKNNEDINWYFNILSNEFHIVQRGEIAIMRRPPLESLAVLVDKLIKHREESSPAKLENICLMVNSLCDEDTNHIWGELYRNFAYQSEELQWSKNHFHEFLPGLLEIITSRSQKYRNNYDLLNSITKNPMSLMDMLKYLPKFTI